MRQQKQRYAVICVTICSFSRIQSGDGPQTRKHPVADGIHSFVWTAPMNYVPTYLVFHILPLAVGTDVPAQTPLSNFLYGYPRADVIIGWCPGPFPPLLHQRHASSLETCQRRCRLEIGRRSDLLWLPWLATCNTPPTVYRPSPYVNAIYSV